MGNFFDERLLWSGQSFLQRLQGSAWATACDAGDKDRQRYVTPAVFAAGAAAESKVSKRQPPIDLVSRDKPRSDTRSRLDEEFA
jgi:hypothetical protein